MSDNAEGAEPQVTFKVKTSGDGNHTITMSESATVLDLKTKLSGDDYENIPVERQRLIYSGRVMKNDDTLATYKIKQGNTIHMVKSAASNPTPAPTAASAPTPQAVPTNMAAGTSANNLLAGLTGARFAGHANLPSRDLFGADGGMGAPPNEEQMAEMLSNPAIAQTMNEALNNPQFVDFMIQQNPMLRNMPNAREMLQSPMFRSMMTNPEAIRTAAQLRRMMGGNQGAGAFPAPGATDTTPSGAPASGDSGNNAQTQTPFPGLFPGMFGAPGGGAGGSANAAANPFASLFNPFAVPGQANAGSPAPATSPTPAAGADGSATERQAGDAGGNTGSTSPPPAGANTMASNPFAALFGAPPGQGAAGANPLGLPPLTPEMMQQAMQMWGMGGLGGLGGAAPQSPPDNRPPEERYAEQLRQLNEMGFYDFERNVAALRRSGGSVQGAIEHLLSG
ncbi:Deubiquitination-protection protein dph1 [Pleurostoma richardsiae]|uniref:Deubiquitination-protection protein dph1 n=1 Tax=Pleurostoma richardsiae TaxID=41990 RepID=A0AA38S0R2_9PEZI|nr:Deubiquitination-protection protein dph1 [Pleurostoma richardsiae]